MIKPVRIQRKRSKGFDMEAVSKATNGLEAVSVARPGKYGNPYKIGNPTPGEISSVPVYPVPKEGFVLPERLVLTFYKAWLELHLRYNPDYLASLKGKNLACFCPLSSKCHADILLRLANLEATNDSQI